MAKRWKKKVILAKTEVTYGVDPTPTGAANAVLCTDLTLTPFNGQTLDRNTERPTMGGQARMQTGTHVLLTFKVEAQSSGALGTPVAYGPILRACMVDQTISAGVSVVHEPISANEESVTFYWSADGTRHKVLGSRGNARLMMPANEVPYWEFSFIGLYVAPGEAADPVPVWTGYIAPRPVSKQNTPTFTLHGYAAVMKSFTVDLGNVCQYRNRVGQEQVNFIDRNVVGECVIEAPAISTKDYFSIAEAETLGAFQMVHGIVAGKVIQLDCARVQVGRPAYENDEGVLALRLPLYFVPTDAGDDDITITFK